ILQEEMRRVVAYLVWKARWWETKVAMRSQASTDESILNGVSAYAWKQASLQRRLAAACVSHWSPPL
ncbi:hypothetical protein BKA70DRAFT_1062716, partial [Coprinopsis sp. MPI-PUGE-AT-0042]